MFWPVLPPRNYGGSGIRWQTGTVLTTKDRNGVTTTANDSILTDPSSSIEVRVWCHCCSPCCCWFVPMLVEIASDAVSGTVDVGVVRVIFCQPWNSKQSKTNYWSDCLLKERWMIPAKWELVTIAIHSLIAWTQSVTYPSLSTSSTIKMYLDNSIKSLKKVLIFKYKTHLVEKISSSAQSCPWKSLWWSWIQTWAGCHWVWAGTLCGVHPGAGLAAGSLWTCPCSCPHPWVRRQRDDPLKRMASESVASGVPIGWQRPPLRRTGNTPQTLPGYKPAGQSRSGVEWARCQPRRQMGFRHLFGEGMTFV